MSSAEKFHPTPLDADENGDVIVPDVVERDSSGKEVWQGESLLFDHYLAATRLTSFDPHQYHADKQPHEEEPKEKSNVEKLFESNERFRFMPYSLDELQDISSLTGREYVGGAATFLNAVFKKQQNVMSDKRAFNETVPADEALEIDEEMPRRTLLSIIGRFESYAKNANSQRRLLIGLTDMINARGTRRSEPAGATPILQEWEHDGSTRAPILTLLRARETDRFIAADDKKAVPFKNDPTELAKDDLKALGDEFIASLKSGQLQEQLTARTGENTRRFEFWVAKLQEARQHSVTRAPAELALKHLGVIKAVER
jgi:hypothetical protein